MHTEQNQINLSSKVKSLSFCFLLTNQMINIAFKKISMYRDMAKEKSILIIFNEPQTYGTTVNVSLLGEILHFVQNRPSSPEQSEGRINPPCFLAKARRGDKFGLISYVA